MSSTYTVEDLLTRARRSVEVEREELDEARRRRDLLAVALRDAFPGSETYVNGSVAHGDALTPLTDVDVGVIVVNEPGYGPWGIGPHPLMERARDAIKRNLSDDFPKLAVIVEGQHRAVLVRFGDPVTKGEPDFTADVIVAVDNPDDEGLFIPNLPEGWDRSHPQKHTEMVRHANTATKSSYAHVVRLLKAWSRRHGKPLCSWNIKALALGCIRQETTQTQGLLRWFEYAIGELGRGLTEDPAGVAPEPIKLNLSRAEVVAKLGRAKEQLTKAVEFERRGLPLNAQRELSKLLPDLVPSVPDLAADDEYAAHRRSVEVAERPVLGAAAASVAASSLPKPRSWAP